MGLGAFVRRAGRGSVDIIGIANFSGLIPLHEAYSRSRALFFEGIDQ